MKILYFLESAVKNAYTIPGSASGVAVIWRAEKRFVNFSTSP